MVAKDDVTISVSRDTYAKLNKLKKGDLTYDDIISACVLDADFPEEDGWDVAKIDEVSKRIRKKGDYVSIDSL